MHKHLKNIKNINLGGFCLELLWCCRWGCLGRRVLW